MLLMNQTATITYPSLLYYRLVALWVLSEALLGGIIHGLKIPVSGLVVGSCAVVCISLIGWYVPARGAILRATVIVAIFKMMLSPHTPPAAYIAVFFQGMLGELLFYNRRVYRAACFALAVLTLLESALQRILALTIVYGNDLWKAVNEFINGLTRQQVPANYSLLIAGMYVGVHLIAGLFIGWWVAGLPVRIARWSREGKNRIRINSDTTVMQAAHPRRGKWLKKGLFVVWIILVALYVQSAAGIGMPLLPASMLLKLLLRSFVIVLTWYFLISPLLRRWLQAWLRQKQKRRAQDIEQVVRLLPATQALIRQSWRQSSGAKGLKRITACVKMILVNALQPASNPVFILSGPVHTGKTSSLLRWSQGRDEVYGILSPVAEGKRIFRNVHTGEQFTMEAMPGETGILTIGRYVFSQKAFDRAAQVVREAMHRPGWLVIDEIGPLELDQKGFYTVLKEVLEQPHTGQTILLVVREGLVERVKEVFGLSDVVIVRDIALYNG